MSLTQASREVCPRSAPAASMGRRGFVQAGVLGIMGLTLGDQLRAIAAGKAEHKGKSAILIWLDGGPSQLESYDPKPDAPPEYRGPFGIAKTNVPGIVYSELLAGQAAIADKLAVLRSVNHGTGDHFAGAHWMLTGRFGSTTANQAPMYPSVGSYVAKVRGSNQTGLPPYVGLPAAQSVYLFPGYQGSAYLGPAYNPFDANTESKYLHHTYKSDVGVPKCLAAAGGMEVARVTGRQSLLSQLDRARRAADRTGSMDALDRFQAQALSMVTSPAAAEAFDLSKENPKTVERYGDNAWGRYTLMARRLVEAGVTFVTVDMPHWDHHSSLVEGHAPNMRAMDQAVAALVGDLSERGRLEDVLVIVMGEFGRTPRINSGQPGIPIPGRDHWGDAFSVMLAGGGIRGGQVVGATNARAEYPVERPLKPHDVLATVYQVLGVDQTLSFPDRSGRPISILTEGEPIREIL